MNPAVNYFFEANLALCLFLAAFVFLLKNETNFKLKRLMLLTGIAVSLIFPALHVQSQALSIPSIREVIPTVMLPEFVVAGYSENASQSIGPFSFWSVVTYIYVAGACVMLVLFLIRIIALMKLIRQSRPIGKDGLFIAESSNKLAPFSFFNFIFIGQADELTEYEKNQIIAHEAIHARQLHSFDIIILNIIGIFFWFNPVIRIYKNIFIQLHEFEADARAVRNEEMNDYCNLLARVALLSADIRLANHFSNSLTLKRIQMMRTIKMKIRPWKVVAMVMIIPVFFIILSCQDQLANEVTDIAKSSTVALDVPSDIQAEYDKMRSAHPEKQFLLVEVDVNGQAKAQSLKDKMDKLAPETISSVNVIKHPATASEPERGFIIVEYTEELKQVQESSKSEDNVYTMVEQTALPADGMERYFGFLGENIHYPEQAREKGVQGKVFVSFIVETDGTLSDFNVVKGVNEMLDAEALRVVRLSPKWEPGKNDGHPVRQRMVLPISFAL
jgi:TonB family protein